MKPGYTGLTRLVHATGYSWQGIKSAWRCESAFRQELVMLTVLTPIAILLPIPALESLLLIISLLLLIMVELLNSAIEAVVDRIGHEHHPLSGQAKDMASFFSLASLLKKRGYHTQFVYGGESHFDNMKTFFLGNGFVDMQDLPTFKETNFVGSWGASDEDLYIKADRQFTKLNKQQKPFFSLVFTSSNHSPYDFPKGRIEPYNKPLQTRENVAKYSDYALGEFFKKARKSDYWGDTIFIVVADHDTRLVSQLDLAPTLLSLMGISAKTPMIGHDLTKPIKTDKLRAMMQFYNNFAWMDNNNVVIFQPEKPPIGFIYDSNTKKMTEKVVSESMIEIANANALWGSLAYEKGYYSQLEPEAFALQVQQK